MSEPGNGTVLATGANGKVYEIAEDKLEGCEVSQERLIELAQWARSHNAEGNEVSGYSYVIRPGDSLWKIAGQVYGDPTLWPLLYLANADLIGGNPNLIYAGNSLRIP